MKDLIDKYIEDHTLSWAPTTLKSERHRLYALDVQLTTTAVQLWEKLVSTKKPYSRVTTWTRVVDFYQWCLDNKKIEGENHYALFRRKNARLFKNQYQTKTPNITFQEAAKRINKLSEPYSKSLAIQILGSAERYSEATQQETASIIGKGNKRRRSYRPTGRTNSSILSYSSFRRHLAKTGLKPHDLRKLAATRLVEAGVSEADLLEIMGWSSIITAKAYLQPKKQEQLAKIFKTLHEELK